MIDEGKALEIARNRAANNGWPCIQQPLTLGCEHGLRQLRR